jgi:hypothetical protein
MTDQHPLRLFDQPPFTLGDGTVIRPSACDVNSRIHIVASCTDVTRLRDALDLPGLQSTVRTAIERRIRKLEKAAA